LQRFGLDAKGLEFDGIVVVRPQEIEDESATGRATSTWC
jgi:DNA helicase IV